MLATATRTSKKRTNKAVVLDKQNDNFARAAHVLAHFFVVTARLRRKISCFMENVSKRWRLSLSFGEFRYSVFDIQLIFCNITPGEFAYIWRSKPVGMMAFKFQRTRSHFSSNISSMRCSVSSGKRVENTTRSGVFLTNFEVFHLVMKHCVKCLILLLKRTDFWRRN